MKYVKFWHTPRIVILHIFLTMSWCDKFIRWLLGGKA